MYEALFSNQEEIFKVLSNRKRLEIIQLLTHGEMSVNEMVEMLGISQSNISQHLALLRQAGVVQARREHTTMHYSLIDERIAEACSLIRKVLIDQKKIPNAQLLQKNMQQLYPLVQDVVCGMRMSVSEASNQATYKDTTYFFCATGCKDTFMRQPEKFVKSSTAVINS